MDHTQGWHGSLAAQVAADPGLSLSCSSEESEGWWRMVEELLCELEGRAPFCPLQPCVPWLAATSFPESVSTVLTRPHGLHLFPRLLLFLFNQRVDFETGHCCAAPTGFIFLKPWFQMWTARPVSLSLAKAPTIMGLGVHHCFVSCCSDKIS